MARELQNKPTFLDEFGMRNALPDLLLVREARLSHEGLVQPRPEEVVTLGILPAEEEEFWCGAGVSVAGWCISVPESRFNPPVRAPEGTRRGNDLRL